MLSQAVMTENPKGFLSGLWRVTYGSPIYNYTLRGRKPSRLLGTPPELLTGNASLGQAILAGSMPFHGKRTKFSSFENLPDQANENGLAFLHGFTWLSDLRAVGSNEARRCSQEYIAEWIRIYENWDDFCWRPDVLGARLVSWITHFAFFSTRANQYFLDKILFELGRQSRHLSRSVLQGLPGPPRITALKGLIYTGLALPNSEVYLSKGIELLEDEIALQLYIDGGHVSRNPKIQMELLRDLLEIRVALVAAHYNVPNWLNLFCNRMANMLNGMLLGDGGLARFNGGTSGQPDKIKALLSKEKMIDKVPSAYLHSGFHRLAAAKTILIMDVGTPPAQEENKWGHAGTLSFELSSGKERLIVNCGATTFMGESWQNALRTTAAHSTLIVDDNNSANLNEQNGFRGKHINVTSCRKEIGGRAVIDAKTDGYCEKFGLMHRRIIAMSQDGAEILGEDKLAGSRGCKYVVRFHLHPNVQTTLIQNGKAALLKPRREAGWKLATNNQTVSIEDSIYIDESIRPRRSQQVTITGELSERVASVEWKLTRI